MVKMKGEGGDEEDAKDQYFKIHLFYYGMDNLYFIFMPLFLNIPNWLIRSIIDIV